jgi:hypothetical protein
MKEIRNCEWVIGFQSHRKNFFSLDFDWFKLISLRHVFVNVENLLVTLKNKLRGCANKMQCKLDEAY